jgi:hypothetical protein
VQLQNAKERFEKHGIKLAAISYDSPEILKDFTERRKIEFPLLSDPDSKIITAFGVLNKEATGMAKGMALPGFFYLDTKGVIREKFFEARYQDRFSPNTVIGKLFPELAEEVSNNVEAPHLRLRVAQSDRTAFPGNRISLTVEVHLPRDVHVYSPGVQGYKPIELKIEASPEIALAPPAYPQSKILYLPAIRERVPVFEGTFRITQDLNISSSREFVGSLGKDGKTVTISGELNYQACDQKICYTPTSIPINWQLQVLPLDLQRAPETIRHK